MEEKGYWRISNFFRKHKRLEGMASWQQWMERLMGG